MKITIEVPDNAKVAVRQVSIEIGEDSSFASDIAEAIIRAFGGRDSLETYSQPSKTKRTLGSGKRLIFRRHAVVNGKIIPFRSKHDLVSTDLFVNSGPPADELKVFVTAGSGGFVPKDLMAFAGVGHGRPGAVSSDGTDVVSYLRAMRDEWDEDDQGNQDSLDDRSGVGLGRAAA